MSPAPPGRPPVLIVGATGGIGSVLVRMLAADGVSGLAYCVGSIVLGSLRAARSETFLEVFQRDVVGAFTAVQAAQDALVRASGSVVLF